MINAGKSIWNAFKLNTARSSKYKISSCSCIAAPLCQHFVELDVQQTQCSGLPSVVRRRKKNRIHDKESNIYLNGWNISVGLVTWIGWESLSVHLIAFHTHRKENSLSSPPPLQKFTYFRHPYPSEFLWPSMGGMDIFWNHTMWENTLTYGMEKKT